MGWWSELLDPILLPWDLDPLYLNLEGELDQIIPVFPSRPYILGVGLLTAVLLSTEKRHLALPFAVPLVLRDPGTLMVSLTSTAPPGCGLVVRGEY